MRLSKYLDTALIVTCIKNTQPYGFLQLWKPFYKHNTEYIYAFKVDMVDELAT